jgi:hypothetical protein
MNSKLIKVSVLSTSVLLLLAGCGKSKEIKSTPPTAEITAPPPEATQVTPPAPTTPAPPTTTPPVTGDGEVLPPLPLDPNAPVDTSQPPVDTSVPPASPDVKPTLKAYEINFSGQAAVKTGGLSNDLFYTSVGDDGLMTEFKSYNSRVSVDQQVMNTNLAKAITAAKLTRMGSSGEMSISVSFNEFGETKTYRLVANADSAEMKLSLAAKGTTGDMLFQGGFLKCLDVDGGCDVAYAKIKFVGGYARIIFRNSMAEMHFQIQEKISNIYAFDLWAKYALNAANALNTPERVTEMQVSSFEVINGRAEAGVVVATADNQALALSVPFVVSARESEVNATATKVSDVAKLAKKFDLNASALYSRDLSENVKDVKLVNNNGRGQFRLKLSLGTTETPASIWIVAARVQKDILTLEQIRAFESKLKNF